MKPIFVLAAITSLAPSFLSAAPIFEINQRATTVSAEAGNPQTFQESTVVPFDNSVFSTFTTDGPGFDYTATAQGRLEITLQGLRLAGTSSGTVEVDGVFIPANSGRYGSGFDFYITIPLEDPDYDFTFGGNTSGSTGASAFLLLYEEGMSGSPLAFYGVNNSGGAPTSGGTVSGTLVHGKSYLLQGGDTIAHQGGVSTESGGYSFSLQIVPEPSTFSLLGLASVVAFAYRRRR